MRFFGLVLFLLLPLALASQSAPPRLSATRTLTIPGEGTSYVLSQVTDVEFGPRGEVIVADGSELAIRVFSPEGALLRTIGRRGYGPAEFQSLRGLGRLGGDTLYVFDRPQQRVSLFALSGELLSDFLITAIDVPGESFQAIPFRLASDSIAFALPILTQAMLLESGPKIQPIVLGPRRGGTGRIVASVDIGSGAFAVTIGDRQSLITGGDLVRLARPALPWTITEDNSAVLVLERGDGNVVELVRHGIDGSTQTVYGWEYRPIRVPGSLLDSLYEAAALRIRSVPPERAESAIRQALPAPNNFPPASRMIAGQDGSIWIAKERVPGSTVRWVVITKNGEVLGELELPSGLEVEAVTSTSFLAIQVDELGVPSIVRYSVGFE